MNEHAADWIATEDEQERLTRASRLQWVVENYPEATGFVIHGGWLSARLLEEAKYCYVYGQYVAVATLGIAFIERVLAAMFYARGRNDLERVSGQRLLEVALAEGFLQQDEFDQLRALRSIRHPLVHFRRPLHHETTEARAAQVDSGVDEIAESDARDILLGIFWLLERYSVR